MTAPESDELTFFKNALVASAYQCALSAFKCSVSGPGVLSGVGRPVLACSDCLCTLSVTAFLMFKLDVFLSAFTAEGIFALKFDIIQSKESSLLILKNKTCRSYMHLTRDINYSYSN